MCSMLFIYSIADNNKISASKLEKEIINCIQIIGSEGITVEELEKAKNKNESRINYYIQSLMNRAERLAYFSSFYDNPNMAFNESKLFSNITIEDIKRVCNKYLVCLLYTSDAADERSSVDLGGRRIIKKKNT